MRFHTGRIPPIPITIYEWNSADLNNNIKNPQDNTKRSVLFVPFEVIRENSSANVILLGSDFFTQYGCCLNFATKTIDIRLNPTSCKYSLEEQDPKNMQFLNSDLDDLSSENKSIVSTISALTNSDLKDLQLKIQEKEYSYQLKKKLKRYKIEINKEKLEHLSNRRKGKFKDENDNLYLKALSTLNFRSIKQIINNLSELDELNEQTSIFLDDEIQTADSVNHIQSFKNQTSNFYLDDTLTDQDCIINVKFANKLHF